MSDPARSFPANPFRGLVGGRLATYFEEAFAEYAGGRIRNAYDYCMLALNHTLHELKPEGKTLFARLESLAAAGKTSAAPLDQARSSDFLVRHDQGITDMDLSYMTVAELQDLIAFLSTFYAVLAERGALPASALPTA